MPIARRHLLQGFVNDGGGSAGPAGQGSLFADEPPPVPTDRLFFAIFPEPAAAQRCSVIARGLRDEFGLRGKPLEAGRFHVTLNHLGDHAGLPGPLLASARQAAAGVAAPAFEVGFDRVTSFAMRRDKRPCVLRGGDGLAALIEFQRTLADAMARAGLARLADRNFTPHVTLLYDRAGIDERGIEPVQWVVREFVLVHSLLGQTKHIPLGRWPLSD